MPAKARRSPSRTRQPHDDSSQNSAAALAARLPRCGHDRCRYSRKRQDRFRQRMSFGPLTTTSVGSFPRPIWLAHTKRNQLTFRLEGDELRAAMDDATVLVLREQ